MQHLMMNPALTLLGNSNWSDLIDLTVVVLFLACAGVLVQVFGVVLGGAHRNSFVYR